MKTYRLIVLLSISLLFLSSFINVKFLDDSNTGFLFYLSITFCFSALLVAVYAFIFKRHTNQTIDFLDLLVFTAFLYIVLRIYYDEKQNFQNNYFVCSTLIFASFFLIKKFLFKDKWSKATSKNAQIIVLVILLAGFGQVLYGFLQLAGIIKNSNISRFPTGFFSNPGVYANYITSILPLAMGCFFSCKSNNSKSSVLLKYFSLITAIGIILILPFTNARAAWIASAFGVFLVLIGGVTNLKQLIKKWSRRPSILLIALLASIILCVSLYNFKSNSAQGRLLIWKISLKMIKDNPIIGSGFDSFKGVYNNKQAEYFTTQGSAIEKTVSGNILYAFNEAIQIIIELGVIGVILLISVLFFVLYKNSNCKKNFMLIGVRASIISILISSLFSYPLHVIPIVFNFMFFIALLSLDHAPVFIYTLGHKIVKTFSIAIVISAILWNVRTYKLYIGYKQWEKAFSYVDKGLYVKADDLYMTAYPLLSYNEYFLYNYGCELSVMSSFHKSTEILETLKYRLPSPELYLFLGNNYVKSGEYEKAEKSYKCAIYMVPNLFYPRYVLAKFYQDRNRINDLLATAKEIVKMDVKVQSATVTEIKWEMEGILKNYLKPK